MAQHNRRPCLDQSLQESRASGMLGKRPYLSMFDWGPISELHHYHGKKCRRMSNEQVRVLEKSFFEVGAGKLEEEKKKKLAQELGLQPHQVVVWFQNRQARWKSQQLHLRNDHLKQASDAVMADNHKLRVQVAELKAELEAYKNNGKDIVLRSVKSESETEVEANESNQTGIKMSRTLGKYNLSKKCSKMGPDACGGGIDIDINMDMDGDNFSSVQDVSSMNLMKCHGDEEESYCSFLTDPDLYYSDSYSCCSLWD